jgi:hypothetical protein
MPKWAKVLIGLAPVILEVAGVPPIISTVVIHGMEEAQSIKGATGAEKKAHVLALVADAVTVLNEAKGQVVLNPLLTLAAVESGIDTTIAAVNLTKSLPGHVDRVM